jgi:hypothetical protein
VAFADAMTVNYGDVQANLGYCGSGGVAELEGNGIIHVRTVAIMGSRIPVITSCCRMQTVISSCFFGLNGVYDTRKSSAVDVAAASGQLQRVLKFLRWDTFDTSFITAGSRHCDLSYPLLNALNFSKPQGSNRCSADTKSCKPYIVTETSYLDILILCFLFLVICVFVVIVLNVQKVYVCK